MVETRDATRRTSKASVPPSSAFHLQDVAALIPCLQHTSDQHPASCSRRIGNIRPADAEANHYAALVATPMAA